jgi:hypothetical protein
MGALVAVDDPARQAATPQDLWPFRRASIKIVDRWPMVARIEALRRRAALATDDRRFVATPFLIERDGFGRFEPTIQNLPGSLRKVRKSAMCRGFSKRPR